MTSALAAGLVPGTSRAGFTMVRDTTSRTWRAVAAAGPRSRLHDQPHDEGDVGRPPAGGGDEEAPGTEQVPTERIWEVLLSRRTPVQLMLWSRRTLGPIFTVTGPDRKRLRLGEKMAGQRNGATTAAGEKAGMTGGVRLLTAGLRQRLLRRGA